MDFQLEMEAPVEPSATFERGALNLTLVNRLILALTICLHSSRSTFQTTPLAQTEPTNLEHSSMIARLAVSLILVLKCKRSPCPQLRDPLERGVIVSASVTLTQRVFLCQAPQLTLKVFLTSSLLSMTEEESQLRLG